VIRGPWLDVLRHVLRSPVGWPRDPILQERAEALGAQRPPALEPGQVVLVSWNPSAKRAALWTTVPSGTRPAVHFIRTAEEAMQLARRVAVGRLAVLVPHAPLEGTGQQQAHCVWRSGDGSDTALDGASFGLAFAIAEVSRVLELPAPSDVCTTAVVNPDGSLGRVEGLQEKLRVVFEAGLGIKKFVVAACQEREAEKIRDVLATELIVNDPVQVVGAWTVAEALDCAFDGRLVEAWTARWTTEGRREEAVQAVFHLALHGTSLTLSWSGVAKAARLLANYEGHPELRTRCNVAAQIADRHSGNAINSRIKWDESWLSQLRRPLRLKALAHIVQSANDSCDPFWVHDATQALSLLPGERDDGSDELHLIGALARLYASWSHDDDAWSLFQRAVGGWIELGLEEQASHALSGLLTLAAVMPSDPLRESFAESAVAAFERCPRVSGMSRAFVGISLARWLEARNQPALANKAIAASTNPDTPAHLRGMRARIATRLARQLGDSAAVEHELSSIGGDADISTYQRHLMTLDAALHAGGDPAAAVAALRADAFAGRYIERIEGTQPESLALAIQRRFPY